MADTAASPPPTWAEALSLRFYAWEQRLRGWDLYSQPVLLEPPFQPFFHGLPACPTGYDDGRTPGLLERLWGMLTTRGTTSVHAEPLDQSAEADPIADEAWDEIVELRVECPETVDGSLELANQVLLTLGGIGSPISFEITGTGGRSALQFAVRASDVESARRVLEAYAPEVVVREWCGPLVDHWNLGEERYRVIADFGLSRESMLPVRRQRTFAVDPLSGFLGVLHGLGPTEFGMLQVLFVRTAWPWADSMLRAVSDEAGGGFFSDAPELRSQTLEKVGRPLFACVIRAFASAPSEARAWQIVRGLGNALSAFSDPSSNEFVALSNDEYPDEVHADDVLFRQTHRIGMLLSTEELAGLVHLPAPSVRAVGLRSPRRTTKQAPAVAATGDVLLGENAHRGVMRPVRLSRELRLRHMHVVGGTGTGKSTLLRSLLLQDIEAGRGVMLLDPHGDLVEDVLAAIPEERHRDVVLFDPSDEERPVGLNLLQATSDREREVLASDLVSVFQRMSTSWGDQMTAVLGNAVLAILDHPEGGTLLELRRLLSDKSFREEYLHGVRDPVVASFFQRDFPHLYGRPQIPILTRLDAFLRPRMIRRVVCQRESKLDLAEIMDQGRILLAKLSQGAIGAENTALLGSLLVSKVHQATLARERLPEAARRDAFLYIDEVQEFRTPSLSALLAGGRKFRVGLVLAHQALAQLPDETLQGALLANAATRMFFRLGDEDARLLSRGFSEFNAEDLQSLGVGEAICRIERADQDCNVRVDRPPTPHEAVAAQRRSAIREVSRTRYGRPRAEIDDAIGSAFADAIPIPIRDTFVVRANRRDQTQEAEPPPTVPIASRRLTVPARSRQLRRTPPAEASPGRGGSQHKYLQALIKRFGEDRGFRATVEAEVAGGGRIDVLLAREGLAVACEISIASTPAQEVENLRKCCGSGADRVVLVSPERKTLRAVEKLLEPDAPALPVSFCTPDELLTLLENLAATPEERERSVRGYRVRTTVRPAGPDTTDDRPSRVAGTILAALKRLKGNG